MDAALLDTDTLNEVLKQKNANAIRHAAEYLAQHGQFAISSITRYELLRGLKEKNATTIGPVPRVLPEHASAAGPRRDPGPGGRFVGDRPQPGTGTNGRGRHDCSHRPISPTDVGDGEHRSL